MDKARDGERIGLVLLGAAIGAAVALLFAPESGAKTRRKIRRTGEDAADYLVTASKDLAHTCEDLYGRSGEFVGKGARELSDKFRDLADRSKELVEEAAKVIRQAAVDR